jgi:hypothetical protein
MLYYSHGNEHLFEHLSGLNHKFLGKKAVISTACQDSDSIPGKYIPVSILYIVPARCSAIMPKKGTNNEAMKAQTAARRATQAAAGQV